MWWWRSLPAAAIRILAARQNWSFEQRAEISEIEIVATVKMGELLKATTGGRGGDRKSSTRRELDLSSSGITKKQSSVAQKLASIPAKQLAKYIADFQP